MPISEELFETQVKRMNREERKVRKAVLEAGGTRFNLVAAVILFQLYGIEIAMEYVKDIKNRRPI